MIAVNSIKLFPMEKCSSEAKSSARSACRKNLGYLLPRQCHVDLRLPPLHRFRKKTMVGMLAAHSSSTARSRGWPILTMIQDVRSRVVVPLAVAVLSCIWSCAADDTQPVAVTASSTVVPAPSLNDPVADWELQFLPAIDAHMTSGRLDSVIILCQLGLEGDSTRIIMYNLMASAYAEQGLYDAAAEALGTAVRPAPDFTIGWANLGGMFSRLGRFEEALPYLRRAASLDVGIPAAHRRLGEAYHATGQYNEVIIEIRAAMKLLPHDATLTFFLGRSQEGLGETEGALASYLHAGTIDPGYGDAHEHASALAGKLERL